MAHPTKNFLPWQEEWNKVNDGYVFWFAEPYMINPEEDDADLYILANIEGDKVVSYEAAPFYKPEDREKNGGFWGPETYYLDDGGETLVGILAECRRYHPESKPMWELP